MASFITDVKKIVDKQSAFVANSQNANAQSLADYLPNGPFYFAKNMANSTFRKMLSSLALELVRKENAIQTIADDYYPFTAVALLEQWETALRIPDECFSVDDVSLDRRQRQVIAKLALDGVITREDFIALAAFFGFTITIAVLFDATVFPMTFPATLGGDPLAAKFTMIVRFTELEPEPGFPYTFPMTFPPVSKTAFLECLITKLAPANVSVIFKKG